MPLCLHHVVNVILRSATAKMFGIDTISSVTRMQDVQAGRNRSDVKLIRQSMRKAPFAIMLDAAITFRMQRTSPEDAVAGLDCL
jgi:hypothetical protein